MERNLYSFVRVEGMLLAVGRMCHNFVMEVLEKAHRNSVTGPVALTRHSCVKVVVGRARLLVESV